MLALLAADEIMANKLVPVFVGDDGEWRWRYGWCDGDDAVFRESTSWRQLLIKVRLNVSCINSPFFTVILIFTCVMHFSLALSYFFFSLPLWFSHTATNRKILANHTAISVSIITHNVCSLDSILAQFLHFYLLIFWYKALFPLNKRRQKLLRNASTKAYIPTTTTKNDYNNSTCKSPWERIPINKRRI